MHLMRIAQGGLLAYSNRTRTDRHGNTIGHAGTNRNALITRCVSGLLKPPSAFERSEVTARAKTIQVGKTGVWQCTLVEVELG